MSSAANVLDEQAQPTPSPEPAVKTEPKDETKALHEELARLKRENAETKQQAEFWARKAEEAAKPETKKAAEPKPESPDEFIDDLSKRGVAAILDRLPKGLDKEAMEDLLDRKLGAMTEGFGKQAALVREYPDLNNPDSELHKLTMAELESYEQDDKEFKRTPTTIKIAARTAAAILEAKKAREDKKARMEAANGYGGEPIDDEDAGSTRVSRRLANAAATMGISPEDIRKAKERVAARYRSQS